MTSVEGLSLAGVPSASGQTPPLSLLPSALVLVDAANKRTRERLDPALLHALTSNPHIPTVLVLNKVRHTNLNY